MDTRVWVSLTVGDSLRKQVARSSVSRRGLPFRPLPPLDQTGNPCLVTERWFRGPGASQCSADQAGEQLPHFPAVFCFLPSPDLALPATSSSSRSPTSPTSRSLLSSLLPNPLPLLGLQRWSPASLLPAVPPLPSSLHPFQLLRQRAAPMRSGLLRVVACVRCRDGRSRPAATRPPAPSSRPLAPHASRAPSCCLRLGERGQWRGGHDGSAMVLDSCWPLLPMIHLLLKMKLNECFIPSIT